MIYQVNCHFSPHILIRNDVRNSQARFSAGFTLMEILFALLLLGGSLTVLLGLQGASVQKALSDRNQRDAMLVTRSILAFIENEKDPLETQTLEQRADELLLAYGYPRDQGDDDSGLLKTSEKFQVKLSVEPTELPLPIPNTDALGLERIELVVSWSDLAKDSLRVVFYRPRDLS